MADESFSEKHYRIGELAALWFLGRETLPVHRERRARRHQSPYRKEKDAYDVQRPGIGHPTHPYTALRTPTIHIYSYLGLAEVRRTTMLPYRLGCVARCENLYKNQFLRRRCLPPPLRLHARCSLTMAVMRGDITSLQGSRLGTYAASQEPCSRLL